MKKPLLVFLLAIALTVIAVGVASADPPEDNPNVVVAQSTVCEDGTMHEIVVVPGGSVAGLAEDIHGAEVIKSLYIFMNENWILIYERGIQGNPNTVWCEWDVEGLNLGGEVLMEPAHGRPD